MYDVGDAPTISTTVYNAAGVATDATVVLTITAPDGTTSTPSVTHGATDSGFYSAVVLLDQPGPWYYLWTISGAVTAVDDGQLDVADPAPPTYASLVQLKTRMRRDLDDTTFDDELVDALQVASRDVEDDTGRPQFYLDKVASARVIDPVGLVERGRDGWKLLVDDIGTLDGLIVEIGDPVSDTWTAITDFMAGPSDALAKRRPIEWLLRPYVPWTFWAGQRVRVTARWGWPAIHTKINQATLLRAQRVARRKDSPEGVAGFNDMGVVRLGRYDPDYDKLIKPFLSPGFGA